MYQFTLRRLIWVQIFLLSLRESYEVILGYLRSSGVIFRSMQNYSNYTTKWSLWRKLFKQLRFKVTPEEKSKNPKSRIIPVGKVFFKRKFSGTLFTKFGYFELEVKKVTRTCLSLWKTETGWILTCKWRTSVILAPENKIKIKNRLE